MYNGDCERMSKSPAGVFQQHVWDIANGVSVLIMDGNTGYVTGFNGLPLEQITSDGTVSFYHQDQI